MNKYSNSFHPAVLFIPETGIYSYLRGLAVLGDAIQKGGRDVLITHCTGQMLRCPMIAMYGFASYVDPEKKAELCKICAKNFKRAQENYHFSSIELGDLVEDDLFKEIDSVIKDAGNKLEKINFRGFPVGKIVQYDFILETKFPYYSNLSQEHRDLYSTYIKNTALTIDIADKICQKFQPSLLLTFNEYAQCQAVRFSAQNNHVSRRALTYPVNFNIDPSRFSIWKTTYETWRYNHCQQWDQGKEIPIQADHVRDCWEDAIFRMFGSGSHIFSAHKTSDPGKVSNQLGLDPAKKTIIAYTSSQDERTSVETAMKIWQEPNPIKDAFLTQIEWLLMLQDYSTRRDDIQIVIRIHPREGTRQFGFDSQHLQKLKDTFTENSANFKIIWPDDPISSYDLMELADLCLVPWSLMGQEAARVGIPVLSYTANMFYPDDDFIQVAKTKEEYKERLDQMINFKYNWQHLVKAVRFYHWRTLLPSLDFSNTVPRSLENQGFWPLAPSSYLEVINKILFGKQDLIDYNINRWKKALPNNAVMLESAAMKRGIRMFLDRIFYPARERKMMRALFYLANRIWRGLTGKNIFKMSNSKQAFLKDYCLKYSEDIRKIDSYIKETKKDKNLRILVADGSSAILIHKGESLRRMSPVIIRLAKLHEQAD